MKYGDHEGAASERRRQILKMLAPGLLMGVTVLGGRPLHAAEANLPPVAVYKSPSCGCCGLWSDYIRAHGFRVQVIEMDDLDPIKRQVGVPGDLESCHTAFVGGYVVEGHVPAPAIMRLLKERPEVIGIAVSGMPAGSPGMPAQHPEPYQAITFAADGRRRIYMSF